MPIYEYKCEKCDKVFEVRRKFSDEPLTTHEECGGPVHRLISAPAFQFKGSGWYVTDYGRSGASKKEFAAGEAKADKSEAKAEGKSESKAESKPDSKTDSNGSKASATESKSKSSGTESATKSDTKSDTSTK